MASSLTDDELIEEFKKRFAVPMFYSRAEMEHDITNILEQDEPYKTTDDEWEEIKEKIFKMDMEEEVNEILRDLYDDDQEFNETCEECEKKMTSKKLTEEEFDEYGSEREDGYCPYTGNWFCINCREDRESCVRVRIFASM